MSRKPSKSPKTTLTIFLSFSTTLIGPDKENLLKGELSMHKKTNKNVRETKIIKEVILIATKSTEVELLSLSE